MEDSSESSAAEAETSMETVESVDADTTIVDMSVQEGEGVEDADTTVVLQYNTRHTRGLEKKRKLAAQAAAQPVKSRSTRSSRAHSMTEDDALQALVAMRKDTSPLK